MVELTEAYRILLSDFSSKEKPDAANKNDNSFESETEFKVIDNAYSVLIDPVTRGEYDTWLRTSSAIKSWKKTAAEKKTALPGKSGLYGSPEALLNHFSFMLWDIEDLLRRTDDFAWDREYNGLALRQYVLKILIFIDKWVLEPAGYPDYFMEARKLNKIDINNYLYTIGNKMKGVEHRPFVNITDYFYDIRKRLDRFINDAVMTDLGKNVPGCAIRLIDCIFEAKNFTVHYLSFLHQALAGEMEKIPTFRHSHPCFNE